MKKNNGFIKRVVAILLSSMLAVGTIQGTALAAEVQENTVQEGEVITTYAVTLDANGGYFVNEWDDVIGDYIEYTAILNKQIPVGETVTTVPVFETDDLRTQAMIFSGWSLERDGEPLFQGDEEYVPVDNCVLYAVWETYESVESPSNQESIEYPSDTPENDISLREEGIDENDNDNPDDFDEDADNVADHQLTEQGEIEDQEEGTPDNNIQMGVEEENSDKSIVKEEAVDSNEQKQVTTTDITPVIRNAESDTSKTSNDKNSLDAEWLNDIDPIQSTGYYYRNAELIEKIEDPQYSHAIEFDASYDTSAVYDLNKMYDTFSGTVCTGKPTGSGVFTVSIYCDGVLTHKISDVTKKNNYISFSLDVSDVSELEIRSHNSGSWGNGWVYLADGLLTYKASLSGIQLFESKDFVGVWEGEYDGSHVDDVIRRHFVLTIDECIVESGNIAKISGRSTISQSIENPSEYYTEGIDNISGTVNLKTGAMSFRGIEWIQHPENYSSFEHGIYNGNMSPDKQSIRGIVQNVKTRTYYAEKSSSTTSSGLWMTIFSNRNEDVIDGGHAFLNIENETDADVYIGNYKLSAGDNAYIAGRGFRSDIETPVKQSLGGIHINYEGVQDYSELEGSGNNYYRDFAWFTVEIQLEDLEELYRQMRHYGSYDFFSNNCTHFASKAWNSIVDEVYKVPYTGVPGVLKDYIIDTLKGKTATILKLEEKDIYDILLMDSQGNLMPWTLDTGKYVSAVNSLKVKTKDDTSVILTWDSPRFEIGTNQYNITEIRVQYSEKDKADYLEKVVPADCTEYKVAGLRPGTKYSFRIYGVSDHYFSNIGIVTGAKTHTICEETTDKANQSITVKSTASSIAVGQTATVSITGAKGKKSFKSSDTSIATVNASTGVVTGKKDGTVTITATSAATSNYNAASKTIKITVNKVLKKPGNCHFTKWNNSKYTSCRISWNKVEGAEGYQTLLSWTDGSHASETIVKSNVLYRDCTVVANHVSQMKVRAFYTKGGKRVYSPWSNVDYITPSPAKLTTKNASSRTNLKMNISWNIIYGCNGYNVFITTNPNGTWYWNQSTSEKATAISASIVKCGGAKLKKNKRYYVRIVTRRKRNGVFCTVPMPASNTYIGSFIIK